MENETSVKEKVEQHLKEGYVIATDSKDYITLRKPKKFQGLVFGILLLCGFIPGIIYLIAYASMKEKIITIQK